MCDNISSEKPRISSIKNPAKNKGLHIKLFNEESNLQDIESKTPSPNKLNDVSLNSPEARDKNFAFQSSRNYKSILENRNDPKGKHYFINTFRENTLKIL